MNYIIEKNEISIDEIYFQENRKNSYNRMLDFFKIKKNTYFSYFFKRLYDELFDNYTKLYTEYKKYYKKEFSSYDEFLSKKYNLFDYELSLFSDLKKLCHKKFSYADDNIVNTLCDSKFFSQFEKYMEQVYED